MLTDLLDRINRRVDRFLYRGGRPHLTARMVNAATARFFARGFLTQPEWVTLEVRGRRSGHPVALPVAVPEIAGERYLVSMLGERAQWPRNVRAAHGHATLVHGSREPVLLVEVDPAARPAIIKEYLRIAPGARAHIPVDHRAPVADFEAVAAQLPVFRVVPL